jgi:hypothetical protein
MANKSLIIHAIDCKVHSTGFDAQVVESIEAAVSTAADVGKASVPFTGKIGAAVGAALAAAGTLSGAVGDLIAAIDRAGDYPDQLYLSLSNSERVNKIWPASQSYYEILGGQIVRPNLIIPFTDAIDINFWEYDTGSSDDFLGRLTVDTSHTGGVRYQVVARPSEGNVYVVVYSVEEEVSSPVSVSGNLLWYRHTGWSNGVQGIQGPQQVGTGWQGFKSVFATSDGIIYAIQPDGKLLWYRHSGFFTGVQGIQGPQQVGTGWANFKSVFATSDGIIYAIQPDGKLLWYRHSNYQTGTGGFAGPQQVGTGWANFKSVFATRSGVIYAIQPDGKLLWYYHQGWQNGTQSWAGPVQVGTGWANFKSVFATSNGIIYGINP